MDYHPAYVAAVQKAIIDQTAFFSFKRDPGYRIVLEHVSEELGGRYLEEIRRQWPELLNWMDHFKKNDKIGNPHKYKYPDIGEISPTTLRYAKVACDLQRLFNGLTGLHIAEIGGGYGGQFLICDILWELGSWTFFDLDPVLNLTSKYLECHSPRSPYKTRGRGRPRTSFDLVVSNYAFCELDFDIQEEYLSTVLMRSSRGYLTVNSPIVLGVARMPGYRTIDEEPSTRAGNQIVVWGAK